MPVDVSAELERILSNPRFQASERRRAFLRFIVDETLAGRGERLKGYTIALAVFRRDGSFDPQADPVVRLEARRLRRDLDSYYMDAGRDDPVRISIPKGSYVPNFEWHHALGAAAAPRETILDIQGQPTAAAAKTTSAIGKLRLRRNALIAAILATVLATSIWLGTRPPPATPPREPAVLVLPFEALSSGENARYFATGIGQELIGNLFRFAGFRLYMSQAGSGQPSSEESLQLGRGLGLSYIVKGSVQTSAEEVRVITTVLNATSGEIVWARTLARSFDPRSLADAQRELANEIAIAVGQSYGVVKNDVSSTPPQNMDSYACVLRAFGYRRTFARAGFDPVLQCLEQTVRRDPEYSDAWAMLGWLHADAGRLGYFGDGTEQSEYAKALAAADRAVNLQPNNSLAVKALAAVYHFTGRYAESDRLSRQAIDLNPNDPDVFAQFGWRLAIRGNFAEGVPMLQRAIRRTINPPGWYFHMIAIDHLFRREYEEMLSVGEKAALRDSGFSQLLIAVANGELGHRDATQAALEKMLQYKPLADDPAGFLRRNGAADQVVDALMAGLHKAQTLVAN
ncbi:hypothetical protein ACE103_06375 [Bradyrhizobium sp. ma5]|uniref:tetratricopeptide repeat protein n=1 Tax=Bradyrhizobium sp. ma5 TaxID=3344828 RepID=UPI0035D4B613